MRTYIVIMLMMMSMGGGLYAQDSAPTPIVVGPGSPVTQQMIDMVMDTVRPKIFIGWNWGASLRQVNADLHSNVWHIRNPFTSSRGGTDAFVRHPYHEMSKTVDSMRLIMVAAWPYDRADMLVACPWYVPLWDSAYKEPRGRIDMTFSGDDPIALTEAMAIRYQPEYTVTTPGFTPMPGDTQGAVFGFQNKAHGTVSGQRFVLQQTGLTGTPTVLSGAWPNVQLVEWDDLSNTRQSAPFNGRRMYAAINLRRHDAADVADNDDVVLRLKVQYKLCNNATGYIRFDSLPNPNGATGGRVTLPVRLDGSGRGQASLLLNNTSGNAVTEMVITRRMIPRGSDATRDITLMAHFILDANPYENVDAAGTIPDSNFNDMNLLPKKFLNGGCNGGPAPAIRELNVEVVYEGRSDVSIDWVQLASDNGTRFLQGYHDDLGREACAGILDGFRRYDSITNKGLRIYRWFSRDEGRECYWEGMRYFNQLFWNKALTERGTDDQLARYNYMVGADLTWQGQTPVLNTRTIVPYYKNGFRSDPVAMNTGNTAALNKRRSEFLMTEWGSQSEEDSVIVNYDLRWGVHPAGNTDLPAYTPGTDTMAWYPDIRPNGTVDFTSGGLQAKYETHRYQLLQQNNTDFLFDDLRPWVANPWLHSDWSSDNDQAIPAQNFNEWRVLSGEEARLLMHSQIILGSKGLVFYWGASMDSVVTPANYNRPNGFAKDVGISSNLIHPLWFNLALRSEATADTMSAYLQNLPYNSDEAGGDYLIRRTMAGGALAYGYRFGLREAINGWVSPGMPSNRLDTVQMRLGLASNDEVYVGTHSIRLVTKEVTDVLWRGRDTLQNLRLRGWYSAGFRDWFRGDSAKFAQVFGTNMPVLKARHLYRDGSSFGATAKTYESQDSTFVEATVLQNGTTSMNSSFVVGVLNRRCDPFDYTDVTHSNYQSYRRWDSTLRATSASLRRNARYKQAGAREILIPFNYKSTATGGTSPYKLLRVREFGVDDDPAVARKRIDTVIGQDKTLSVMFLPGEGKMFHVQVVSSESNLSFKGFLDHSNQRKVVAFPVMHSAVTRDADVAPVNAPVQDGRLATWTRYVAGDTMRYHAVYHRRDSASDRLRVYYVRSKPVGFDNRESSVPRSILLTPGIEWETPVDISNRIIVRKDGLDSAVEQGDCGFPSIVVRPELDGSLGLTWPNATSLMRQRNMVYVSYACKECPSGIWNLTINHIKFPADIPNNPPSDPLNDSVHKNIIEGIDAYRLDMFMLPSQAGPQVDSALFKWGTPTIGASTRGNFIAWSHPNGIKACFLYPQEDALPPGRTVDNIKLRAGAGFEVASHPSINTYSRLNLGECDNGLVWQEGPNTEVGSTIAYTRLFADVNGNTAHHIARNMATRTTQAQWGAVVGGNDLILEIASMGQTPPPPIGINQINRNMRFPMIFRNLSDYDITNTNLRYTEGLVSQKAERIFWETQASYYISGVGGTYTWTTGLWEIGRRAIDVNDYGSHDSTLNPMIWGRGPYLIWSDTKNLYSPNVAQGEQVTENNGVISPVGPWYADSVNVLNFTSPNASNSRDIYNLVYGFSYYGAAANHALSTYTPITKLGAQGWYPQLAARFSMAEHPGWQRNRRIYEAWSTTRVANYFPANSVRTNQEQFYKEGTGDDERVIEFTGYRDDYGRTWSVGGIRFADDDTAVVMHNTDGDGRFTSGEVQVPTVTSLYVNTRIEPGMEGARMTIRRVSDGAILNVPLGLAEGEAPVQERQWSMVSDATERYTFSLETDDNAPLTLTPVSDIAILSSETGALQRRAPQGLIDLRAMKIAASDALALEVYPTPASDHVTVVMTGKMDVSGPVTYSVTDLTGRTVLSGAVDSPGLWHLDVNALLNGSYQLHVRTSAHHVMTRFVIAK